MQQEHWEYYTDVDGQWRSRFVAANGKILFVASEGYHNKEDMLGAIDVLESAIRYTVHGRRC